MNRVAIFLRNKLHENKFSESVLAALNSSQIDSALLCSGFFQEDKSYSVSKSKFSGIVRCKTPLDITLVGFYGAGKNSYKNFISGLKTYGCQHCVKVKPYYIPGYKWHAKVFIGKQNGRPKIAAIGSSNITRRAFDTLKNFNYECDVLFWDETDKEINRLISQVLGESTDEMMSVVVANVDKKHPVNKVPINKRLEMLEKEIMAKAKDFT